MALRVGALYGAFTLKRLLSNVTVVGCGLMGSGIAAICASSGYNVKVLVGNDDQLKKSEDSVLRVLHGSSKSRSEDFVEAVATRIILTTDVNNALSDSEMVIEAVTEDLKTKCSLFQSLEHFAPSSCVFASNTSSLPINEIVKGFSRKEFFGGLHFFNPVQKMKLVEITRCSHTSGDTLKVCTLAAFAESLGKTVVHCKDTPGFIVNRLLVPYLLEAIEMWERRDASLNNIDMAMRLGAGHPMGPFELADHVGLDTLLRIIVHWVERHPEERAFRLNTTVRQLVAQGRLGKKCGHGFFMYDQRGRIIEK
ncbi:unnamed protein product [Hydatigera taeniaeformis]|uniref:3HCDH_N domain-containing protein n=1 Tax=Hydatigena taeniaeformis TaxID=6205 RepID=A0A0R3WHW0_HYDTA|nr:unnamed protein product [Hydatigera taeniaeformis]